MDDDDSEEASALGTMVGGTCEEGGGKSHGVRDCRPHDEDGRAMILIDAKGCGGGDEVDPSSSLPISPLLGR